MMKLRLPSRPMLSNPNHHWTILINTLRIKHRISILISIPHLTRCKLWMNHSINSRKWGLHILPIPLSSYWPRNLLRILSSHRNLKHWSNSIHPNYGHSIYRICSTMGPNKILRGNCNHQPIFCNPLYRQTLSRMNMRRIRRR